MRHTHHSKQRSIIHLFWRRDRLFPVSVSTLHAVFPGASADSFTDLSAPLIIGVVSWDPKRCRPLLEAHFQALLWLFIASSQSLNGQVSVMIPFCVQWDKQNTQINGGEIALRNNPDRFQLKIHENAARVSLTGWFYWGLADFVYTSQCSFLKTGFKRLKSNCKYCLWYMWAAVQFNLKKMTVAD